MDGLTLELSSNKEVNIIMGLKNNNECRKMAPLLEEMLIKYFDKKGSMSIGILDSVYTKEEFTEAVNGGQYQMGIVLEKLNDTPIGQGAIKQWKRTRPDMRIILVMDKERYATGKVQGLYDRGIYDGLFQSDFGRESMLELINKPRTEEEAYIYYGLKQYAENENKKIEDVTLEKVSEEQRSEQVEDIVLQPVIIGNKTERKFGILNLGNKSSEEKKESVSELETLNNNGDSSDVTEDFDDKEIISAENAEQDKDSSLTESVDKTGIMQNGETSQTNLNVNSTREDRKNVSKYSSREGRETDELIFSGTSDKENTAVESEKNLKKELETKKENVKKVITAPRTVKSKSILNSLDNPQILSEYLEKVSNSLKQEYSIKKSTDEEKKALYNKLLREYGYYKVAALNDVLRGVANSSYFLDEVFDFIDDHDETVEEKERVYQSFYSFLFGYERLEKLIEMEEVQSIHVIDYNNIRVKKKNGRATANISFIDENHYARFLENLLQRNMNTLIKDGLVSHFTDRKFSDKYVLSVSIFDSDAYVKGVKELIIKKSIKEDLMMEDLIGTRLSMRAAAILVYAAQTRKGVLFCGPRGSGVVQMMQVLLNYIPFNRNGIVLQHRDELTSSRHPELLVQQPIMKTSSREGYSLSQIAEDALQKDIDYYIMSEAGGSEVVSFYKAMNYGFTVWTTIKAMDCEGALLGLLDNILAHNPDYNRSGVAKVIEDKIEYVVYMEKFEVLRIAQVKKDSFDFQKGIFNLTTIESKNTGEP